MTVTVARSELGTDDQLIHVINAYIDICDTMARPS